MRRIGEREKGATTVIVAILLVALLGFAALAIDIANMTSDRKQLQNGADAAALAIAQSCAIGDDALCNDSDAAVLATNMAEANRNDGDAAGVVIGAGLNPGTGTVTVETQGRTDHWLAGAIGIEFTDISTRSRAIWGGPSGATSLPLTISYCELTNQPNVSVDSEGRVSIVGTSPLMTFYLTGPPGTSKEDNNGCPLWTGAAGSAPGGFGYLMANAGACTTETSEEGGNYVVPTSPGNTPHSSCSGSFFAPHALPDADPVLVPVFNWVEGTGAGVKYTVAGYAAFKLEGYRFGGSGEYNLNTTCNGNDRCLHGRFVEWIFPEDVSGISTNWPYLGAATFRLTLPE